MSAHFFLIDELESFLFNLEAKQYHRSNYGTWVVYSKALSKTLIKHYAYLVTAANNNPIQIRVTYELLNNGKPLQKLLRELKNLNHRYRQTLPGWKTKREPRKGVRENRWQALQKFLYKHGELISCFKYEGDDRLTEGNCSFNLHVASTPREQKTCLEFIKALAEAYAPHSIIRKRREPDKPVHQRNGWIKRYSLFCKKRGWRHPKIVRDIQEQLRSGTWNERSRIQYNIADNTICKIAGIKITPSMN